MILALTAALLTGAAQPDGAVTIEIGGLRSSEGQVLVCLTREADHFPDCSGSPSARSAIIPASRATVTFDRLPRGLYAIAVLHDENANGRADRALGLIPREGFGFSRDAPVRMGPPRFAQAAFAIEGAVTQTIRMRYLL